MAPARGMTDDVLDDDRQRRRYERRSTEALSVMDDVQRAWEELTNR